MLWWFGRRVLVFFDFYSFYGKFFFLVLEGDLGLVWRCGGVVKFFSKFYFFGVKNLGSGRMGSGDILELGG